MTFSAAAVEHWQGRIEPYLELMRTIELPPRGPRGSKQNVWRRRYLAAALHQLKVAGMTDAARRDHRPSRCRLCRVQLYAK